MNNTVTRRQKKEKKLLLEQFRKTPIVQVACEKSGIGRASYYRWRKQSQVFVKEADAALAEGTQLINEMAESLLLSLIKDKNMTAIIFWLKNHHSTYATKVEVTTNTKITDEKLTPEQQAMLKRALTMGSLISTGEVGNDEKHDKPRQPTS